jgi:hypothetical protein
MSNQNEYPDKYLNYYSQVIKICEQCDLYSEIDEECLVNDQKVFDIVISDEAICPIGEW